MKRLAILGASGHGKVVADAAVRSGWKEVVFFDDAWPEKTRNSAWPVDGTMAALVEQLRAFEGVFVAIGNCRVRVEKHELLKAAGGTLVSILHPAATLSSLSRYGAGCVFMAGAIVNIDAVLGDACIVNTGATVDHDCRLGDGVQVCPGANVAGNVVIGARSWIGIGASVRQGIRIGSDVMVGAGAVVVKPVPDGATVVGNPARQR